MISLRKLEEKDAPLMLEWMHEKENADIFQTDFMSMDIDRVLRFIHNSFSENNQHFAVVDEKDTYLGTISLKGIDYKNKNGEYAISMHKNARGTGASKEATMQLLTYAFDTLGLEKVYLCVLETNVRARKFYEKCGYQYEGSFRKHMFKNNMYIDLYWYSILKDEFYEK